MLGLINLTAGKASIKKSKNIKLKSIEEVSEMLLFEKNSFGIQIKENCFIIWSFITGISDRSSKK
jgi:hypothetical protein